MSVLRPSIGAAAIACAMIAAGLALAWWLGPHPGAPTLEGPIQLHDVTRETQIAFTHTDGNSGQKYIVETITAGLALFDYDGDGYVDIYFLNGTPLGSATADGPPKNTLYRNQGGWRFTDVTDRAGVGDVGFGLGVAVADFDNDGHADLFVNNYGPNVLYQNNGDGTFTTVTQRAGVEGGHLVGAGANFLDIEGDGDLDLYVANYVKFTYDNHVTHAQAGFPVYAGPNDYLAEPDILYRNNGDGTFTDVSLDTSIKEHAGSGMGTVCCDFDGDGDTDIFVLNDVSGNFLFVNDGTGKFEEMGLTAGAAYNVNGDELGSMGIDCGDYDNDGWLDFFMTSYQTELPVLYRNLGNGFFEDVTTLTGAGDATRPYVNWGTGLVDFDNDGDRDIFIACGHLQDNIDSYDKTTSYHVRNVLLMNTGDGQFVNVSDRCGDGLLPELSSRGAAFDDLDNDGDVDAVILNSRREPTILRNESQTGNHWIQVRLKGSRSNRDGVGSQVLVAAGGRVQVAEVHSGRGYQSHFGMCVHFGLGKHDRIDRIEVRWLGGQVEVWENVRVDQFVMLTERASERTDGRTRREK